MTDLGFGIVDRRSVLVVLFTLLLSQIVLGNPVPIDTTSAIELFSSLVILTGFIYVVRLICRVVLAVVYTLLRFPFDLIIRIKHPPFEWSQQQLEGLRKFIEIGRDAISHSLTSGFLYPIVMRRDWSWCRHFYGGREHTYYDRDLDLAILGIVDRLLLVGIAVASTMPRLSAWRVVLGTAGILMILVVYVATGRFTFVLMDAFHKKEEDGERLIEAASTQPQFPSVIRTKPERDYDRP